MEVHELLYVLAIVYTSALSVLSQIPADRTWGACFGSRVEMTFDDAAVKEERVISWHFTPVGSSKEELLAYATRSSSGQTDEINVELDQIKGRLEKTGERGIVITNCQVRDSGQYRTSQDNDKTRGFYNITVQDPCLNTKAAADRDGKRCVALQCSTSGNIDRIEVREGSDTTSFQGPRTTYCGVSLVHVECIVTLNDQELRQTASFDLTTTTGGLGGVEIAGIVVGGVVLFLLAVLGLVLLIRRTPSCRGFHRPGK